MKILYDAFDLLLLRVKPLETYRYPLWQVLAFLAAVSVAVGTMAELLRTDVASRALFVFLYKAAQYWVMARFLQAWLRLRFRNRGEPLSTWNGEGSLFTLLVLLQAIDFLQPLLSWFDPSTRVVFGAALFLYSMVILVLGLVRSTGAPVRVVIGGLVLCAPMLMLVGLLFANVAVNWGWIDLKAMATAASAPRPPT